MDVRGFEIKLFKYRSQNLHLNVPEFMQSSVVLSLLEPLHNYIPVLFHCYLLKYVKFDNHFSINSLPLKGAIALTMHW